MSDIKRSGTFLVKGEKIKLTRNGVWVADGTEITHQRTCDAFFRAVRLNLETSRFEIQIGYERIEIEVEDTAFFVTRIEKDKLHLSSGQSQKPCSGKLEYKDSALYFIFTDPNSNTPLRAKFLSAPYYEVLSAAKEQGDFYLVDIAGQQIKLHK